jgi:predicted ATPase
MEIKPYLRSVSIEKPRDKSASFPFTIPAVQNLDYLEFHADVTFLIGENGAGKSTLLEAIASVTGFGAQGGSGNFAMDDPDGKSNLDQYMRPKRSYKKPRDRYFLRAESFYNVGTYLQDLAKDPDAGTSTAQVFKRYGGKPLHQRSHGESVLSLLVHALSGHGLYIMDEPEAALSPNRQLAALVRIHDLVQQESQFIIATHSPILMAYPNARIYLLDEQGCHEVEFEETEHYRVTRDFLNHYPKRIKNLLSDQPLLDSLIED